MLKPFFPAVLALVVGIVLGAWQPRGELLALRAERDDVRAAAGRPCQGGAARSIRDLLRTDEPLQLGDDARSTPAGGAPVAQGSASPDPLPNGVPDGETPLIDTPPLDPAAAPQTPQQIADAMHTALDARRAQAMAALQEQGRLDHEQVAAVNAAMDQMNREIKAEVEGFVTEALAGGDVDRRDIMDFAAESLDIVIAADDRLRGVLPEEVYAEVDDGAVDPFSYVSGDTLDALERLQDIPGTLFE